MSPPLPPPEPVDPGDVLAEHLRAETDVYRAALQAAYVDPKAAYVAFRTEAARLSPAEAAMHMHRDPSAFGELKEGGAEFAQRAALLGGRAYHARIAQADSRIAAEVLDRAFIDAVREAGADPDRVGPRWSALSHAHGQQGASSLVSRHPADLLGAGAEGATVMRIARLAAARDLFRLQAGIDRAPEYERTPALPRSLAEERAASAPLPEDMRPRLVAAADGMRRRFAVAYADPVAAEARLHAALDANTWASPAGIDPLLLGALRPDHPGGPPAARAAAEAGLAYARIAYEYHRARFPDAADELAARDAVRAARLSARDPDRAMEGLDEAIQLHGPALERHLARAVRTSPGDLGPDQGGSRPGGDAGSQRPPARDPATADAAPSFDPAVDHAVTTHRAHEEARALADEARTLREQRGGAEAKLAQLDEQDRTLARTRRDFRAVAERVYQDPEAALRRWDELVLREQGHLERANERLQRDPSELGRLRTEPHTGWRGALGMTTTDQARSEVPALAGRATAYTRAQRAVQDPVEWTGPDGHAVRGREPVRAAASEVVHKHTGRIETAESKVRGLGGVRGSEQASERAFSALSPDQRRTAGAQAGRKPGAATAVTGLAGKTVQAARLAKTLGEGPAGL